MVIVSMALAGRVSAVAQPPPPELAALLARARPGAAVAAWCRGEFRPGHPRAFAAAIASASGGGEYVVLDRDGGIDELTRFSSQPDLSCYTRADARKLDDTIRRSETIHGHVAPRWNTTVVCAFSDATTAACWQYSPVDRQFVKVGDWTT